MKTCPSCLMELPPQAAFCLACGTRVPADAAASEDPLLGTTLKETYFVEKRIGGGGMGDVYLARHVTLDAPVALKILKRSLLADPSLVQRFQREARAASRLRHPNIVQVTDFGALPDGTLFMAMEHVLGADLGRLIAEKFPIAEERVVRIGAQILSALSEAHENGILHRDLKPGNVMIASRRHERDLVKVLDFGIAKIQQADVGGATLTQTGIVCGTPGYMSPEQWNADPLDPRSDLYSVGVILYELLTGHRPLDGKTPLEMVRELLTETVTPPSLRRGSGQISHDLESLVMRALSADREQRPRDAEAMRTELLATELVAPATPTSPPSEPGPKTEILATPARSSPSRAAESRAVPGPSRPITRGRPHPAARAVVLGAAAAALGLGALVLVLQRDARDLDPAAEPDDELPALTLHLPSRRTEGPAHGPTSSTPDSPAPDSPAAPGPPADGARAQSHPERAPTPPSPRGAPGPGPRTASAPLRAAPARPAPVADPAAPAVAAEPEPQPVVMSTDSQEQGRDETADAPALETPGAIRSGPSLEVQFTSARSTRDGGSVSDTLYSEKPGDARLEGRSFDRGMIKVSGVVGLGRGSTYAGIGLTVWLKGASRAATDASGHRKLTIWLSSRSTERLRIRLLGTDRRTLEAGCYPVFVQPVSEDLTAHEILLSEFSPERFCKEKGRSAAQTLSELSGIEVLDSAIQSTATSFTVGAIYLEP